MQKTYQPLITGRQLLLTLAWVVGLAATSGTARAQTFAPAQTYPVTSPSDVAVADVNADGRPDLLTAGGISANLGVLLGNGDGTFQTAQYYQVGVNTNIRGIAVVDVNGDGRPDLITTNENAANNSVSILLGNGNGTFQTVQNYLTGGVVARNLAVVDVNGDGRPDILTANFNSNNASVLLGNGNGTFQTAQIYSAGAGTNPTDLAVTDVSGDGRPDLVLVGSSVVGVLLGNGNGTFQAVQTYSTGASNGTGGVAVADVNGDGRPDILTANAASNTAGVLLGNGNGTFQTAQIYPTVGGSQPRTIVVSDFNGDGRPDLVTAGLSSNLLGVLLGNGNGTFQAAQSYSVGTGGIPYDIAAADVNNDGKPDLLTANSNSSRVGVLLNTTVFLPAISTLAPTSGPVGSTVTLNGSNLAGTTAITFTGTAGNTVTSGYTVNGAGTQLTGIVVPSGATTGNVTVTAPGGTSNGVTFTVTTPLSITAISPVANAVAVAATSSLAVTFNQPLDASSAPALKVFSSLRGGLRTTATPATVSGNTLTFAPSAYSFQPGETLFSTVTTAATAGGAALAAPYVFQLTTATTPSPGTFGPKIDYTTGLYPNAVALGDVNNDGVLDMATVNDGGTASVLLGISAGGFSPKVDYPTGSYPDGIALGDVNGDGKLDLVASNSGDLNVSVLLGTGTGSFGTKTDYPTQDQPYGVTLGDVNGDGRLDIVTANINASTASVLLGTGTGSFGVPALFATNYSPASVALGDVNGDGKLDMVTANAITLSGIRAVSVLLGSGTGSFGPKTDYAIGASISGVALGDVNGDSRLDLVTANSGNSTTSVLLGTGTGTFGPKTDYATGSIPYSVALGDVNGDGRLDIVTANTNGNSASVLIGAGTGAFATRVDYATGGNPANAVLGDVNHDGRLDIVTSNTGNGNGTTASVLLGATSALTITGFTPTSGLVGTSVVLSGTGFTGTTAVAFSGTTASSYVVNSDTQITVSVPTGATTGPISVTMPGGTATSASSFTVTTPLTIVGTSPTANARAATATGPVAVTFNQAVTSGSTAALKVFSSQRGGLRSSGSGSTTASGSTVSFAPTYAFQPGETAQATVTTTATAAAGGSLAAPRVLQFTAAAGVGPGTFSGGSEVSVDTNPTGTALADIDGDGDLDALVTSIDSRVVSVRFNNGSGSFSGATSVAVGYAARSIATGDLDNDGDLDMLVANYLDNTVSVRFNNGNGTFSGTSNLPVSGGPVSVAIGDVDGDGDLDFVTANTIGNSLSVRINSGNGLFSSGTDATIGANPTSVVFADVDNDGDLDLLAANGNSNSVSVVTNNGSGVFSNGTDVAVGMLPSKVVAADVDGDGDIDLLVANINSNTVSVRFNNGTGTFSGGSDVAVGTNPYTVTTGDVDGDGDLDLLTANRGSATVSVRLNNGSGVFSGGINPSVGLNSIGLSVGDLDGDGDLDFLAANQNTPGTVSVRFNQNAALPDLIVSTGTLASPVTVAAGTYNSITVTGTGIAQFGSGIVVNTNILVQTGGVVISGCQPLTGAASFTLEAGTTLNICDPAGIAATGSAGAIQTTGVRSFSAAASYWYNGSQAQLTGSGLPAQVQDLVVANSAGLTLSQGVSVAQVLRLVRGNLTTAGQPLTLLSSAAGTALVVNSSTGVVSGPATVQRYIDPSLNAGAGYRHFSAPVSTTTVADLATAGFSPEVSQAAGYNSSATPGTTTPFPTVFGYDQSRVTLANAYAPFDRGFAVPAALSTPLVVGQGYAVNIPASPLVDFVGSLTNGDQTLTLSRVAGNTDAGWQLLGNPYPAPLDYALVAPADRTNLDGAIYVYSSTAQYVGQYRAYLNGVGGNSVLPVAQGFFVRVSAGQTSGSLTFRNAQRLTAPNATAFQRATDYRPLVHLELRGATGPADALYAYAQAGATPAFDNQFDAEKLANPTGLNLSSIATSGQHLAIDGRPLFDAATVLPLAVGVPAAGTYTFAAVSLSNLPTGLDAYLLDAQTGQQVNLRTQPSYPFTVTAAQASALLVGRFSLRFAAGALATSPALTAAQVALYPNPTHEAFTVLMPGVAGAPAVQAMLLNALGQVVRRQSAALPTSGASFTVETADLAAGVYTLRLQAGSTILAKRVVIQ